MFKKEWVCIHLRVLSTRCVYKSYISKIYMYKHDLELNNQQWLICHKTQPNQTKPFNYGQIVGQTEFFSLGKSTRLGKRKLWIQTSCTPLKIWPGVISCLWRKCWINTFYNRSHFFHVGFYAYQKLQCISQLFKPEKLFTKHGVNLDDGTKIQIFPIEWSTRDKGLYFNPTLSVDSL